MLHPTTGEMGPDPISRARELVEALGRFCKSVEEIAAFEFDVEAYRMSTDEASLPEAALFVDARLQLLSLTELVQQTNEVLGELFTEIEALRTTRNAERSA